MRIFNVIGCDTASENTIPEPAEEWASAESIRFADLTIKDQAALGGLYDQLSDLRGILARADLHPGEQLDRLRGLLAATSTTGLLAIHDQGLLAQTLPETVEQAVYSGQLSAISIALQLAQYGQLAHHELPALCDALSDYLAVLERRIVGLGH
ncbi:MAG: hypothetical protein OHK0022_60520 [Roseiflexaceae bacterium]